MASWQKRILRYAISRSGLLDERTLDLDNLHFTLGKTNTFEFKDVGLNIGRLEKLVQLPPNLRVEAARIVSLCLTVLVDVWETSLAADVDGVEIKLRLEEPETAKRRERTDAEPSSSVRSPPHGKEHPRSNSELPYDPGGPLLSPRAQLPTTEEMATSFLMYEPVPERREIEKLAVAKQGALHESTGSGGSDEVALGTGAITGLPGFLANFLQGVLDRSRISIKNVDCALKSEIRTDTQPPVVLTLSLRIGAAELSCVTAADAEASQIGEWIRVEERQAKLTDLSLELISDTTELSEVVKHSPNASTEAPGVDMPRSTLWNPSPSISHPSSTYVGSEVEAESPSASSGSVKSTQYTTNYDRFADALEDDVDLDAQESVSELDIRPGDDNISWGSRRSQTAAPSAGLWNSVASEEDLPGSLLLHAPFRSDSSEPQGSRSPPEGLAQSRVFSHDEAESMYLSAMTSDGNEPRGLDSQDAEDRSGKPPVSRPPVKAVPFEQEQISASQEAGTAFGFAQRPNPAPASGRSTPRPPVTNPSDPLDDGQERSRKLRKQLARIDMINVSIPTKSSAKVAEPEQPLTEMSQDSFASSGMPGTFSAYAEMSASRLGRTPSNAREPIQSTSWTSPHPLEPSVNELPPQTVKVGTLTADIDVACGALLKRIVDRVADAVGTSSRSHDETPRRDLAASSKSICRFKIRLDRLDLGLGGMSSSLPALLLVVSGDIQIAVDCGTTRTQIGFFQIHMGGSRLLGFDRDGEPKGTVMFPNGKPDILIRSSTRYTIAQVAVTRANLETLPVNLSLDLSIVDEVISRFGGWSGILDAGSTITSDRRASPPPPSANRTVRFENVSEHPGAQSELKVNSRIEGVNVILQGETCRVKLRTTAVKVVHRATASVVSVNHVILTGPHLTGIAERAEKMICEAVNTKIFYLLGPQEKDLERLVSLLTTSQDRYDDHGEILIDTLIRQRKKGGVVRVCPESLKINLCDRNSIDALKTLGKDVSKLSAVTKYLPQNDSPGILTLLRSEKSEIRLSISEQVGSVSTTITDLHCAHVGFPALFALSVGSCSVTQGDEVRLVHSLVPSEALPVIMARMLGDEVEPTMKIKLFNICVEYSVPAVIAFTGLQEGSQADEIVAEVAKSIFLPLAGESGGSRDRSPISDVPPPSLSPSKMNLQIHHCAIGLQPQHVPSKAMLILTDAQICTESPSKRNPATKIELRRVEIFVADQPISDEEQTHPASTPLNNIAMASRVMSSLASAGFVSIGSFMSVVFDLHVEGDLQHENQAFEVGVKTESLLLETCADSTQTLFAILEGLIPPALPNQKAKYLTEPMTIEDMMASFTGKPVAGHEKSPEMLFDIAEQPEGSPDDAMFQSIASHHDSDGLLTDSEMTSSLYGPVSGLLGSVEASEASDEEAREFQDIAESLLEDDPFEMTDPRQDQVLSDAALVRELKKQCWPAVRQEALRLDLYEISNVGRSYDPLAFRVADKPAEAVNQAKDLQQQVGPLVKLRLRDAHIMWNIYDGFDWQRTREGIAHAVEKVESKADERMARHRPHRGDPDDEESVIGDFLFNSIYIGIPSNRDAQALRKQINKDIDNGETETESLPISGASRPTHYTSTSGRQIKTRQRKLRLERARTHKVAFELQGVSADMVLFPPDCGDVVSRIDLRVKKFEIFDKVPTSTWRKFLTQLDNDPRTREMSRPMIHLELSNVKTLENYAASEVVIHISVLPLRLHVDQDCLDFITRFFEFKDDRNGSAKPSTEQPFLQRVEVDTVDMCLDYKPKKVDYGGLRSGHTDEFVNFVVLDAANIRLKHAIVYGIRGFEPLHKTLNDVWMPDIKRNQLPTVLAGLAPMRSLANIGTGVRDVVAIPIREYRRDGRLVRSIQKGAMQFGKTTTSELARLGAKMAIGTQNLLSGAEDFLVTSAASSSVRSHVGRVTFADSGNASPEEGEPEERVISAYADQPLGVVSGLRSARRQLEHDLLTAKDALIAVQGDVFESSSPGSAAAALARRAPTVILRPVIGASKAVGTALLGLGNQVDAGHVRKMEDVSVIDNIFPPGIRTALTLLNRSTRSDRVAHRTHSPCDSFGFSCIFRSVDLPKRSRIGTHV